MRLKPPAFENYLCRNADAPKRTYHRLAAFGTRAGPVYASVPGLWQQLHRLNAPWPLGRFSPTEESPQKTHWTLHFMLVLRRAVMSSFLVRVVFLRADGTCQNAICTSARHLCTAVRRRQR